MVYYNKIGMDSKIALFFEGKRITEYIYDTGQSNKNIIVMQRSNIIDIFDNITGKHLYHLKGVTDFVIKDNFIILCDGLFWGARLYDGTVILKTIYSDITVQGDYFIVTKSNEKKGVYRYENNILEEIISPQDFTDIRIYENGIMVYKLPNHSLKGFYSLHGKQIIEPKYAELTFNSKGINVISPDNKRGFYTHSGKEIIPPLYYDIKVYNNCCIVSTREMKNGRKRYGLYGNDGKQILKPRYDSYQIKSPFVIFTLGKYSCVYDMVIGRRILPLKYVGLNVFYNVIYASEDYKTFRLYSAKTGDLLLDNKFEKIEMYEPTILKVTEGLHSYYYLTTYNVLINSEEWYVNYSYEYKEALIRSKNINNFALPYLEWSKCHK